MSFNLYDFVVSIKADSSQADAAIANSGGALSGLTEKFGGMKAAGVAAFAALGVAGAKFASDSVKVGMEFDKSMSQVAATMGITNEEMEKVNVTSGDFQGSLRDLAVELGSRTAFSATQASESLNYMALAGYDAQTSADMLPKVLDLAAAGNMDLARASDMVTDSQSALGLSLEETETLVNQMAKASSKSNTSVEQLGDAILRVGGTAKGMKGGTTELTTALGILADNGTKGAEGGTALRNVLLGIKSAKFEKTFGKLGVSAYDANGEMRSLEDVFLDMQAAMDGMTQEQRDEIITKTFNKADLKNINALLGTSKERWDDLTASIEDSDGAAAQMAETQLDNLSGDVTLFQSALEGAQIAVSDGLSPALRDFVQTGAEGLSNISSALNEGGFGAGIAAFIEALGNMGSVLVSKLITLPGVIAKTLSNNSGEIISAGLSFVQSLVQGVLSGIPNLISSIPTIISGFVGSIIANLPTIVANGVEIIITLVKGIVSAIPRIISTAPKIIIGLAKTIQQNLPKMIQSGKELIAKLAKGITNNIPKLIAESPKLVGKLASTIIGLGGKLLSAGVTLVRKLASGIGQSFSIASIKIGELIVSLKNTVTKKAAEFANAGLNIVKGIWRGISNGKQWIKNQISGWVGDVKSFLKKLFGIASPSKWARKEIGYRIPQGMALGILDGKREVEDAMEDIIPDDYEYETTIISGGLSDAITLSIKGAMQSVIDELVPEMQESMIQAMEGIQVKLDARNFGRLTREAVNGTI